MIKTNSNGLFAPDRHKNLTFLRAQTFHDAKATALGSLDLWILSKVKSFLEASTDPGKQSSPIHCSLWKSTDTSGEHVKYGSRVGKQIFHLRDAEAGLSGGMRVADWRISAKV